MSSKEPKLSKDKDSDVIDLTIEDTEPEVQSSEEDPRLLNRNLKVSSREPREDSASVDTDHADDDDDVDDDDDDEDEDELHPLHEKMLKDILHDVFPQVMQSLNTGPSSPPSAASTSSPTASKKRSWDTMQQNHHTIPLSPQKQHKKAKVGGKNNSEGARREIIRELMGIYRREAELYKARCKLTEKLEKLL